MTAVRDTISANLRRVWERMADAAAATGRSADEIRLVGVTKYVDASLAAELFAAGCADLGENRPQELWEKAADPRLGHARWHLVGHLQRNKVARTLPLVSMIQSVDSERLLRAIDDRSAHDGRTLDILLEVNCSGDATKHGFSFEEIAAVVPRLGEFPHVRARGLMTMASREGGRQAAREDFARLRELRDRLQPSCPMGVRLDELSMGMSGDLEEAIAEGATIVRVGSALFAGVH